MKNLKKISLYIFFPLLSVALCVAFVELVVLKILDSKDMLSVSYDWIEHNRKINSNNYDKILLKKDDGGYWDYLKITSYRSQDLWRTKLFHESDTKVTAKRILIMGDSFAWGDGYANMNHIWWRQLQKELNQRGYHDVEVIARGQNGWTTRQELMALQEEKLIEKYKPDAVIFGYVSNDPDEQVIKTYNCDWKFLNHKTFGLKKILPRISSLTESIYCNLNRNYDDKTGYPYGEWEKKILHNESFEKYKSTLSEVAKFTAQYKQIPIFFISLSNAPTDAISNQYSIPKQAFEEKGIKFFNIHKDFVKEYGKIYDNLNYTDKKASFFSNSANGHPGVYTTSFYAKQVVDILEKNYRSALPPKNKPSKIKYPLFNDADPIKINLQENEKEGIVEITYNAQEVEDKLLSKPLNGNKYLQLNLSYPTSFKQIQILETSDNVKSVKIGYIKPKDMNPNKIYDAKCSNNSCALDGDEIESLIVQVNKKAKSKDIKIVIKLIR